MPPVPLLTRFRIKWVLTKKLPHSSRNYDDFYGGSNITIMYAKDEAAAVASIKKEWHGVKILSVTREKPYDDD